MIDGDGAIQRQNGVYSGSTIKSSNWANSAFCYSPLSPFDRGVNYFLKWRARAKPQHNKLAYEWAKHEHARINQSNVRQKLNEVKDESNGEWYRIEIGLSYYTPESRTESVEAAAALVHLIFLSSNRAGIQTIKRRPYPLYHLPYLMSSVLSHMCATTIFSLYLVGCPLRW